MEEWKQGSNESYSLQTDIGQVSSSPRMNAALHLTSTPKQILNQTNSTPIGYSGSSGSLHVSDTEEEENNNIQCSNDRLNYIPGYRKPRYTSRSLPVTPRVNENSSGCGLGNNATPSNQGFSGISTPMLLAPHLANQFLVDGSYNSLGSLSPSTSQYVTCSSGFMAESPDKIIHGSIDYSSLPLPKDESFTFSHRRNISRHLSEPSIPQSSSRYISNSNKSHSCPQRKSSFKNRRRDMSFHNSDPLEGILESSAAASSLNGIEQKLDELESMGTQWKFIKTLVDELNSTRAQNNRMAVELHQAKLEIQMLSTSIDSTNENALQAGVLSEMIGQIHAAQKFRDEAMMSRIKLANEERDAAITHSRTLLQKLGLSSKSEVDLSDNNGEQTRTSDSSINPSSLEEELKALRIAIGIQELNDKAEKNENPVKGSNQDIIDELKAKLCQSEASRWQLQEKCSRYEGIFDKMRRKMNGFTNLDSFNTNPSSLTLLDMTLFSPSGLNDSPESFSNTTTTKSESFKKNKSSSHKTIKFSENSQKLNLGSTSSSDMEQKDSLSSLESVETASVSSWKKETCSLYQENEQHSNNVNEIKSNQDKIEFQPSCTYKNESKFIESLLHNPRECNKSIPKLTECDINSKLSCHKVPLEIRSNCIDSSKKKDFINKSVYEIKIKGPITEL